MSADGRFAPSPTGPLHLGSLRTALAAWLFARSAGARFLVRVEDLDPDRSRRAYEEVQLEQMRALGIDWDGPVVRQSERLPLYAAALERLEAEERVYPCFCTRAEIRSAVSAPHGPLPEGAYPGTCRRLSASERDRRIAAGERYALRFDADLASVSFLDRLAGPVTFTVDDFVLRRSDGAFAYGLAVVVDDAEQRIGEVVRGADLLESTARQILLARVLSLSPPRYAHVPLVLGPDGRRLAKRHGGGTVPDSWGPRGLRWLGRSLGIPAAVADAAASAADLLSGFAVEQIPPGPITALDL